MTKTNNVILDLSNSVSVIVDPDKYYFTEVSPKTNTVIPNDPSNSVSIIAGPTETYTSVPNDLSNSVSVIAGPDKYYFTEVSPKANTVIPNSLSNSVRIISGPDEYSSTGTSITVPNDLRNAVSVIVGPDDYYFTEVAPKINTVIPNDLNSSVGITSIAGTNEYSFTETSTSVSNELSNSVSVIAGPDEYYFTEVSPKTNTVIPSDLNNSVGIIAGTDEYPLTEVFSKTDTAVSNDLSNITGKIAKADEHHNTEVTNILDKNNLIKSPAKKNFCIFCKKQFSKLARHLESIHKNESEVKKFIFLPKGCCERKKLIEIIRKKGNFEFKTNEILNEGARVTCRKPQVHKTNIKNYIPCPSCKCYYSRLTLEIHYRKCHAVPNENGRKNIMVCSRRVQANIHKKASDKLKNDIFPILRDDEITDIIRYDELIIIYGNKMCTKYRSPHHNSMIRTRLRLIGRFMIEIKKLNPIITDFASVLEPIHYDNVIKAINMVAQLDEELGRYKAPSTAFALGTALKANTQTLIFECIKNENEEKKKLASLFMDLMNEDFAASINQTVNENQLQNKRQKKIILPTINDIKLLNKYLATNRTTSYIKLSKNLCFNIWKNLASFTLISVLVFNRRRPGEIERTLISDFRTYHTIDEKTDPDTFQNLTSESKIAARRYVRFMIRGKLARGVPVLLHNDFVNCINLILKYRHLARVPENNPYIFGLPSTTGQYNYLRASKLLREYSTMSNAANPSALRATELRKHISTQSVLYNLTETEVSDLASFMGHADKIHRDHYRMPIAARDIANMTLLLEKAQGCNYESDVSEDELYNTEKVAENISNDRINITETEELSSYANKKLDVPKNIHHVTPKKRDSDPRVGQIERRSWSTPERQKARILLAKYVDSNKLPSNIECQEFIEKYPCLRNRTSMQLKLWIQNNIKKQKTQTKSGKSTWTSPEKHTVRKAFELHLKDKRLPSIPECQQMKKKYCSLKNRTAIQIKAFINNEIRRNC